MNLTEFKKLVLKEKFQLLQTIKIPAGERLAWDVNVNAITYKDAEKKFFDLEFLDRGRVSEISGSTVKRWMRADADELEIEVIAESGNPLFDVEWSRIGESSFSVPLTTRVKALDAK